MALTLVNRVRAITNSGTSHSSNDEVLEAVRQGVRYVLSALPLSLSRPFLTSTTVSSNPITVNSDKIYTVQRNGIKCIEVPVDLAYEVADSNSLHYASNRYPVFYNDGTAVYILPAPTVGAQGIMKYINTSQTAGEITSTSVESIDMFDGIAVKYAAAMDYMAVSAYWGEKLLQEMNSTEISSKARDALQNAADLINNKTNYDAEDFLAEEDGEMVASAVQTAAQEVNRALAEMRGGEASAQYTREASEKAFELFREVEQELSRVIAQGAQVDIARDNGEGRVQTA